LGTGKIAKKEEEFAFPYAGITLFRFYGYHLSLLF
jgi:hypothetical protein